MTRRNVLGFFQGPDGAVIHWKCNCGHEGFLDANGSSSNCQSTGTGCDVAATAPVSAATA